MDAVRLLGEVFFAHVEFEESAVIDSVEMTADRSRLRALTEELDRTEAGRAGGGADPATST